MDALDKMNAQLLRIFRGEERYGDGPPAEQARRYRLKEILPVTVAYAKRNSPEVPDDSVDLLVSLSGFSPETTILAFHLVNPKRLMIIGSEATRASVDVIQETLKLPLSRLYIEDCEPTDPLEIYQYVQKAARLVRRDDGPARIIIDITGGKKVMSASAALAAARLDLPMCYVEGDFDPELRQSRPGTERLVILRNPTDLFGDRQLDAGLAAFRHGAYAAAHAQFKDVAGAAYEPAFARFLRDLSAVYQAWCDLDFAQLEGLSAALRSRLTDPGYRPAPALVDRLHAQLEFVDSLVRLHQAKQQGPPLLLNFYLLGKHYQLLGRHDFAALLFYRTIESCFARRLTVLGSGFSSSRPDYSLLHADVAELTARYTTVASVVHQREITSLPFDVGLLDAALLAQVLEDPMVDLLGMVGPKSFGQLKRLIGARNGSVLAHGVDSVEPKLSEELATFALRTLRAFWALEFGRERVDEKIGILGFVVEV